MTGSAAGVGAVSREGEDDRTPVPPAGVRPVPVAAFAADVLAGPRPTDRPAAADVLTVVALDPADDPADLAAAAVRARSCGRLVVLVSDRPVEPYDDADPLVALLEAATLTLSPGRPTDRRLVGVDDPAATLAGLVAAVERSPRAALVLAGLMRLSGRADVPDLLAAESLGYSTLLGGPEFARWRASRPARPVPAPPSEPVRIRRDRDVLRLTLAWPQRRNPLGRAIRDALVDGLSVAVADRRLRVHLDADGPGFCSGGDLDEFGSTPDVATAHLVRVGQSPAALLYRCAARTTVRVHGACIGAGMELPAFAHRVVAAPDAWFRLPELDLGLVPGAGGTVSLPRRIGRWRTAWLALSGQPLDACTAHAWGLVDAVEPGG